MGDAGFDRKTRFDNAGVWDDLGQVTKSSAQSDTKSSLMEAAVLELAEKGWGGLRTREVAERARVNKALVHYHFGSMDNLRYETVAMLMSGVVNEAATGLLDAPTLAEGLREFGKSLVSFRSDDPRGLVLMEVMVHVPREERLEEMILRALDFYEEALRQRVEADVASGRLSSNTDTAALATALTATLDGLVLHAYMRPNVDFGPAADALAVLVESSATPKTKKR
jgi:AcrR family transcriptional regulator